MPVAPTAGRLRRAATALVTLLVLAGCGLPKDPDSTLARIDQEHVMVVGVAPAPPQV